MTIIIIVIIIIITIIIIQRYDKDFVGEGDATSSPTEGLKPRALIIDGPSLIKAMLPSDQSEDDDNNNSLKSLLLEMTMRCKAVVLI